MPKRKRSDANNDLGDIEDAVADHSKSKHKFGKAEIADIQSKLLEWYDKQQRLLPWRRPSDNFVRQSENGREILKEYEQRKYDPAYAVLVSEIMLQQTQVETVKSYFLKWMTKFPTIQHVADASLDEINAVWAGLGYYRRAKLLHQCAKTVTQQYNDTTSKQTNGEEHANKDKDDDGSVELDRDEVVDDKKTTTSMIPQTYDKLLKLPGIGSYTAAAITSIAFGHSKGAVDGNVIRVLSRVRHIAAPANKAKVKNLYSSLADDLVDKDRPGDWNQAMMELGATICTPKNPSCESCPISASCLSFKKELSLRSKSDQQEVVDDSTTPTTSTTKSCDVCEVMERDLVRLRGPSASYVTLFPIKVPKKEARLLTTCVSIIQLTSSTTSTTTTPPKKDKKKKSNNNISLSSSNRYLLVKRPKGGLLSSFWEFPSVDLDDTEDKQGNVNGGDDDMDVEPSTPKYSYASHKKLVDTYLKQKCDTELFDDDNQISKSTKSKYNIIRRLELGQTNHVFTHIKQTLMVELIVVAVTNDTTREDEGEVVDGDEDHQESKDEKKTKKPVPKSSKKKQKKDNDDDDETIIMRWVSEGTLIKQVQRDQKKTKSAAGKKKVKEDADSAEDDAGEKGDNVNDTDNIDEDLAISKGMKKCFELMLNYFNGTPETAKKRKRSSSTPSKTTKSSKTTTQNPTTSKQSLISDFVKKS
eukprot:TRINITY_DN7458_c0_g1_i1.p1 TRINITY_DN7458_c0_g1~~TRINITY_DN7458_c0_g1_i1.p1  ORF type:complete len:698 (+),score=176.65 TRINITY_DN7458_c0_g1_i1:81-2174(+)